MPSLAQRLVRIEAEINGPSIGASYSVEDYQRGIDLLTPAQLALLEGQPDSTLRVLCETDFSAGLWMDPIQEAFCLALSKIEEE